MPNQRWKPRRIFQTWKSTMASVTLKAGSAERRDKGGPSRLSNTSKNSGGSISKHWFGGHCSCSAWRSVWCSSWGLWWHKRCWRRAWRYWESDWCCSCSHSCLCSRSWCKSSWWGSSYPFEKYIDNTFLPYILRNLESVCRGDIIFDLYSSNRLKASTRESRGCGVWRRVLPSALLPRNWQSGGDCSQD